MRTFLISISALLLTKFFLATAHPIPPTLSPTHNVTPAGEINRESVDRLPENDEANLTTIVPDNENQSKTGPRDWQASIEIPEIFLPSPEEKIRINVPFPENQKGVSSIASIINLMEPAMGDAQRGGSVAEFVTTLIETYRLELHWIRQRYTKALSTENLETLRKAVVSAVEQHNGKSWLEEKSPEVEIQNGMIHNIRAAQRGGKPRGQSQNGAKKSPEVEFQIHSGKPKDADFPASPVPPPSSQPWHDRINDHVSHSMMHHPHAPNFHWAFPPSFVPSPYIDANGYHNPGMLAPGSSYHPNTHSAAPPHYPQLMPQISQMPSQGLPIPSMPLPYPNNAPSGLSFLPGSSAPSTFTFLWAKAGSILVPPICLPDHSEAVSMNVPMSTNAEGSLSMITLLQLIGFTGHAECLGHITYFLRRNYNFPHISPQTLSTGEIDHSQLSSIKALIKQRLEEYNKRFVSDHHK